MIADIAIVAGFTFAGFLGGAVITANHYLARLDARHEAYLDSYKRLADWRVAIVEAGGKATPTKPSDIPPPGPASFREW